MAAPTAVQRSRTPDGTSAAVLTSAPAMATRIETTSVLCGFCDGAWSGTSPPTVANRTALPIDRQRCDERRDAATTSTTRGTPYLSGLASLRRARTVGRVWARRWVLVDTRAVGGPEELRSEGWVGPPVARWKFHSVEELDAMVALGRRQADELSGVSGLPDPRVRWSPGSCSRIAPHPGVRLAERLTGRGTGPCTLSCRPPDATPRRSRVSDRRLVVRASNRSMSRRGEVIHGR